ncbi:hypothetical protein AKJ16_DCAP11416 [Drosera capensis]
MKDEHRNPFPSPMAAPPPYRRRRLLIVAISLLFFDSIANLVDGKGVEENLTSDSFTPINRDLYHSSANLMEEIESLVHRHPSKLTMETFSGASSANGKSKWTKTGRRKRSGERRNGRGVDLNRNWSVDWGKTEKDYDPTEENPGSSPFSEPESQIMRKLAVTFEPHALFMPYDHKNTTPDGLLTIRMKSILKVLNQRHFHDRCMVGSGGGSVGYLAHGTATDYMYAIAKVPMAFTFEIYGTGSASAMFNPTNLATFNKVLNDWSAAFFSIFMLGPQRISKMKGKMESDQDKWLEGYLIARRSRHSKKTEAMNDGDRRGSIDKVLIVQ